MTVSVKLLRKGQVADRALEGVHMKVLADVLLHVGDASRLKFVAYCALQNLIKPASPLICDVRPREVFLKILGVIQLLQLLDGLPI